MDKLTGRQRKAFEFIKQHTSRLGYTPTLRELCDHMGYKAVGSAQDVIASLRRKGYLQTPLKQSARSLIISDKAKQLEQKQSVVTYDIPDALSIPCLGSVPAGKPLEAIEGVVGYINVSPALLPRPAPPSSQLFALQARGHSMIGAGILDRDWLIVKSQNEAGHGNIVVARTGEEATVKRLMKDERRGWYLQPENPDFEPIYAKMQPFEIVGKVIALQRSFE
ncbi:MAG: transcriptional repressor LexA [Oligoflexus sp.]